jgi:hypothetical protein
MTAALAVIAALAILYGVMTSFLVSVQRDALKAYRKKWEDEVSGRNATDALLFEWSCRDLMPPWEELNPHVVNMPTQRKYGEWATFCANYPTRTALETELGVVL